jgi:hypothetical protein
MAFYSSLNVVLASQYKKIAEIKAAALLNWNWQKFSQEEEKKTFFSN